MRPIPRALGLLGAIFALFALQPAGAAACPNEAVREQQGVTGYLADCRGYEMSSPEQKNNEEVTVPGSGVQREVAYQAAASGPGIAFTLAGAIPGSESAAEFVQALGIGGPAGSTWSSISLAPSTRFSTIQEAEAHEGGEYIFYSPTLSCGVLTTGMAQPTPGEESVPLLPPGETPEQETTNLYVYETSLHGYELVTSERPREPEGLQTEPKVYAVDGATSDCGVVAFEESTATRPQGGYELPVTPGSEQFAPNRSLYLWSPDTGPVLASYLPDGKPAEGIKLYGGGVAEGDYGALSKDGSRLLFMAKSDDEAESIKAEGEVPAERQQVYMREDNATTSKVSASKTAVPDRGAKFMAASADGNLIFFIANYGLTEESSTGQPAQKRCERVGVLHPAGYGCDLYRYEASSGALTDLSVDKTDPTGADARGVVGISEDGSYVYFTAGGQLAPGQGNSGVVNEEAAHKEVNLYVSHNGGPPTYISTIGELEAGGGTSTSSPQEEVDTLSSSVSHGLQYLASRVSGNGQHLLFGSRKQLTGFDNHSAAGTAIFEYYEYSYTTGEPAVTCVSCDPAGSTPREETGSPYNPLGPFVEIRESSIPRNLLDDGRVFFDQDANLVPQASSAILHVYEWRPAGTEGCVPTAPFNQGCLSLLDNGQSVFPSYFVGASADGENVYVTTPEKLSPQDPDGLRDVYDVRVGGGRLFVPREAGCEENGSECQVSEGGRLDTSKRSSENPGEGNPPLPGKAGNGEVEDFTTGKVKVKRHSHKGTTIALVIAAPGKGRVTVSGASVGAVGKSIGASGTYTVRLTLGAKAKTALEHHKKVKVKLHIAFKPANGNASSADVSFTV